MSARRKLDAELVRRKLVETIAEAQTLIEQGRVRVAGAPATNPLRLVSLGEPVTITTVQRFVSRGGEKLNSALDHFAIEVEGKRAIDVGASTGGFTDCLLQRGAASVVALDVGHAQLHERIRADDRVDVREHANIRRSTLSDFDDSPFEILTVDVSFISLKTIAQPLLELAAQEAEMVVLIKPQFEATHIEVSKGRGVVFGQEIWGRAVSDVISAMSDAGAATMGLMISPILGAEGNVEFLAWLRAHTKSKPAHVLPPHTHNGVRTDRKSIYVPEIASLSEVLQEAENLVRGTV